MADGSFDFGAGTWEVLREVLGIIRRVTFAAGKGVEGIPIGAAKFFEGV